VDKPNYLTFILEKLKMEVVISRPGHLWKWITVNTRIHFTDTKIAEVLNYKQNMEMKIDISIPEYDYVS
jgi:hypothetical protein